MAIENEPTLRDFNVLLPPNFDPSARSVLQLMTYPAHPEHQTVIIYFNGTKVLSLGPMEETLARSFHVVMKANILRAGINTMTIKRHGGFGSFAFSDVVIWYQETGGASATRKPASSKAAPKRTARKQTKRPTKKGGKSAR